MLHQDIKLPGPLELKKLSEIAFVLKANSEKSDMFKYPKVFQCESGSELLNEVKKLLEKHNFDIPRTTTKYKHTHTAFAEAFNKELEKLLFKHMGVQELQDP